MICVHHPASRRPTSQLGPQARLRRRADDGWTACRRCRRRSSRSCSSTITARRKSTPSPSTRTRRQARLRRPRRHQSDDPGGEARRDNAGRDRGAGRGRRDRCDLRAATRPSRAIGVVRRRTPRRCATDGTSPATPAMSDADGDMFVTGRVDDMIITGGENVSPVEIESCLSLHPAVSEVAVVGLPDERWGKIVAAFIKRRAPVERRGAGRALPQVGPREFQAAAPLRLRRGHSEIARRQAPAPQAGRGRVRGRETASQRLTSGKDTRMTRR